MNSLYYTHTLLQQVVRGVFYALGITLFSMGPLLMLFVPLDMWHTGAVFIPLFVSCLCYLIALVSGLGRLCAWGFSEV